MVRTVNPSCDIGRDYPSRDDRDNSRALPYCDAMVIVNAARSSRLENGGAPADGIQAQSKRGRRVPKQLVI